MNAEHLRLLDAHTQATPWRKWGPYQSGTVREDRCSSQDQASSRVYVRGGDGIAGISDDEQTLCFSLALWNGVDPILKERLLRLTSSESNEPEGAKDYYFYLDSTPTHSWMKFLYKYPQQPLPWDLLRPNPSGGNIQPARELIDTGVFDDNRYFDVFVEYGKASPEDILIRITAANHGPAAATLHVLPTLWFRDTWSGSDASERPLLKQVDTRGAVEIIAATHPLLGQRYLYCDGPVPLLFTNSESNEERLYGGPNRMHHVKDGINDFVVDGLVSNIDSHGAGTKACAHYVLHVPVSQSREIRLRLTTVPPSDAEDLLGGSFDAVLAARQKEADEFYASITPERTKPRTASVMRQALAETLWRKEFHCSDAKGSRMRSVATRDLAFQTVALAMVDPEFAKQQVRLVLHDQNRGDISSSIQAWAAHFVYETEKTVTGRGDSRFLEQVFEKLLANFKELVERDKPSGGPAWMAFYSQSMLRIAVELGLGDSGYEPQIVELAEHFMRIAATMYNRGNRQEGMWDEEDGFFYDFVRHPDSSVTRLKLRSFAGLLPLCSTTVFHGDVRRHMPAVVDSLMKFYQQHTTLWRSLSLDTLRRDGCYGRRLLGLLDEQRYRRVLARMLDESEFLSPYGIRSLSRYHLDHPCVFTAGGQEVRIEYAPGERDAGLGASPNWHGPIWLPLNLLLIRSLLNLYQYYGDYFRVECPTGSGRLMNLFEVANDLSNRIIRIFLADQDGRRPLYDGAETFQSDLLWHDYLLFHEYFHGDNGAGLGASHQTGSAGTVARLIQLFGYLTSSNVLAGDATPAFAGRAQIVPR